MSKSVLFVDNFQLDFDNPMSTLYKNKCKEISKSTRAKVFTLDVSKKNLNVSDYKDHNILLLGARSVPFYKCNKIHSPFVEKNLQSIMSQSYEKKFMILQDMHPKTYGAIVYLVEFLNRHNMEIIFTFLENGESRTIRKYCPMLRFHHLPHYIDTNIFRPIPNQQREYDMILYGSVHPTHYPFRKRLFELILADKDIKTLHIIPPANNSWDPQKCERGLAEKINSANFAVATKSRYDYFVAKYLEIAACDTMVVGNMATDGMKVFPAGTYIEVNERMTDVEILEKIKSAINQKVRPAQEFTHAILSNYNLTKYADRLFDIITF